jgi:hypothetical protein
MTSKKKKVTLNRSHDHVDILFDVPLFFPSFIPPPIYDFQNHTNRNITTTNMLLAGRLAGNGLVTKNGTGNGGLETQMRLESFGMFFLIFFFFY